jgi:hypothetical protein
LINIRLGNSKQRGEAAPEFAATLGTRVPHEISETLDVAVANAARDAEASGLADPVVLLSPASRDPSLCRTIWAPAQQRTVKCAALRPGHEGSRRSKHFQFINPLETIMGDQWATSACWDRP